MLYYESFILTDKGLMHFSNISVVHGFLQKAKDLKYDTSYRYYFRGWNDLGPGMIAERGAYSCLSFPTTNMTASYNGSKVDFLWTHVHGSTFREGLYYNDIWICTQDYNIRCKWMRFYDSRKNASIEMGLIINQTLNVWGEIMPTLNPGTIVYSSV